MATKLATSLSLDNRTGEVLIDGAEFGYFLAAEPVKVVVARDAMTVVYLPVVVDPHGEISINGVAVAPGEYEVPAKAGS